MSSARLKSRITLIALMDQERVSQAKLAARSDCSKGFVSHLVTGRKESCSPALAVRIARSLGVPARALFEAPASPR